MTSYIGSITYVFYCRIKLSSNTGLAQNIENPSFINDSQHQYIHERDLYMATFVRDLISFTFARNGLIKHNNLACCYTSRY